MIRATIAALILLACGNNTAESRDRPKEKLAKLVVDKFALEAFPVWASRHPDKACPDKLADLAEYLNDQDTNDPWGHPLRMYCGANLPAGAKGIGVLSVGEDGKEGTADDIKSWP